MDIIGSIINLDDKTIDSVISITEKCSKDSAFSSSECKYFEEIHEALNIARDNLNDYQDDKGRFSKLNGITIPSTSNSNDNLKAIVLLYTFLGIFKKHSNVFFFDRNDNDFFKNEILDHLDDPMQTGHYYDYNSTPVVAISSNDISMFRSYLMGEPLLFCEEGIGFELKDSRINVVPYSEVNKVSIIEKKSFLSNSYKVYFLHGTSEPNTSTFSGELTACINLNKFNDSEKKSLPKALYYFIKCFNSKCEFTKS